MKFGGKWYMAPTDITLETLVYRTDLVPNPPKTWDDLRANALKLTQSLNGSSPTRYGYAYAATPGNLMTAWYGTMGSYGASILDERSCPGVDGPKGIEAWKFFVNLKTTDKVTPPDINAWDYPELLAALQNGTVAQANFFTAGMPILLDCQQSPNVCRNIALVAQPAGPAGSKTRVNPLGIMVNAASDKKDAVWAFVKWATGPVGGKVYTAAGGANPRISILSDPQLSKDRPWTPEVLKAAQAGVGNVRHAQARELGEAFDRFGQQAIAGQITPEDSMKKAGTEMRQILGNPAACR
jgi:ABC-type glycerol-3-phosphate transport system substrate-binding protein